MGEVTFAFELGQVVAHRSRPAQRWVVLEQIAQRCHGAGVQRQYLCRKACEHAVMAERFTEIELEAVPEPSRAETAAEKVREVKDWLVSVQDFEGAASLRDLLDEWVGKLAAPGRRP